LPQLRRRDRRQLLRELRPGNGRRAVARGTLSPRSRGRYVALDGRLWRTLGALLFRPGFLTREYLAGRRRRFAVAGLVLAAIVLR
jgi:hypothetical protein